MDYIISLQKLQRRRAENASPLCRRTCRRQKRGRRFWPHFQPQRDVEYTETGCSKSGGKQADRSVYRYKVRKIVRKKFQSRLVRMRSPVRIWVAAPQNIRFSDEKRIFFYFLQLFSMIRTFTFTSDHTTSHRQRKDGPPGAFCPRRPVCVLRRITLVNLTVLLVFAARFLRQSPFSSPGSGCPVFSRTPPLFWRRHSVPCAYR